MRFYHSSAILETPSSGLSDATDLPPVIEGVFADRYCVESITMPRGAMDDDRGTREERFTRLYDAHYSDVRAYDWRRASAAPRARRCAAPS